MIYQCLGIMRRWGISMIGRGLCWRIIGVSSERWCLSRRIFACDPTPRTSGFRWALTFSVSRVSGDLWMRKNPKKPKSFPIRSRTT